MLLNVSEYSEVNTAYEKEAAFLWMYLFAVSSFIFSTPLVLRQYFGIQNLSLSRICKKVKIKSH